MTEWIINCQNSIDKFWNIYGVEECLLKYPVDLLLKFDDTNIKDKLKDNIDQINKYEKLLLEYEYKYNELKDLYKLSISEQFEWYMFKYNKPLTEKVIKEYYLPKDPKIIELNKLKNKYKTYRDFFKLCVNAFTLQGERMHDFIRILELEK